MTTKKATKSEPRVMTAVLVAKPGDKNKKGLVMKRAKYELSSDDGTVEGVFYAIVPKGQTPAAEIKLTAA